MTYIKSLDPMQYLKYISDFFYRVSILTLIIVLLWVPGSIKSPIFFIRKYYTLHYIEHYNRPLENKNNILIKAVSFFSADFKKTPVFAIVGKRRARKLSNQRYSQYMDKGANFSHNTH